ncbi:MAG: SDR family oxidoreductase [Chloroflexi bacterium]|nr:SDR family oxidoreductase [Chloroflexota bacterium]
MALAGKVVIITGSSRGIGKGLALDLAKEGAKIVVSGRIERSGQGPYQGSVEETVKEIKALRAGDAIGVRCDVTKEDEVANLFKRTVAAFGRIDALINNAGVAFRPSVVVDMPYSQWYQVFDVNVNGVFLCCKLVLPYMIAQRSGNIINVSSGAANMRVNPGASAYGTSKAAMERLSVILAQEVKEHNIVVNAYRPGLVETDLARYMQPKPGEWTIRWGDIYVCSPNVKWLLEQTASTFTGQIVDRAEFGKTWGPKA